MGESDLRLGFPETYREAESFRCSPPGFPIQLRHSARDRRKLQGATNGNNVHTTELWPSQDGYLKHVPRSIPVEMHRRQPLK